MKIALFYNLNFGGAKRVVYEQVKGLKKLGHGIDVYTLDDKKDIFDTSLFADDVFIYPVRSKKRHSQLVSKLKNDLYIFFDLKKVHQKIAKDIDSRGYDIVFAHPDKLTQAPFLLRYLKTPSVYYCQEPLRIVYEYALRFKDSVGLTKKIYEEGTRYIRKKIDRTNTRAADHHLASCLHIRERMIEAYDVYPDISYPGIDNVVFKKTKTKKTNTVIFVGGKDVVTDGYDLVQQAIKLIPAKKRPKLLVVSWKKSNEDRLSDKELVSLYNSAVTVLCLSRLETFGLVPLEAMSCGVPIIATNISGHRETVINNKTGFLVEFHPREIAGKIKYLIENPTEATRMGEEGILHVDKFWSWEKVILPLEKTLSAYIRKT